MDKFRTKNGELSQYAFYCGYIQQAENDNVRLQLSWDSACWKVYAYDFNSHTRLLWECFYNLTEARKLFHNTRKKLFPYQKFTY
jgi:hypothetical protein